MPTTLMQISSSVIPDRCFRVDTIFTLMSSSRFVIAIEGRVNRFAFHSNPVLKRRASRSIDLVHGHFRTATSFRPTDRFLLGKLRKSDAPNLI